jgi:hypothetical protein
MGSIERVRVLDDKGKAFIDYEDEANAQFAIEAMAAQSLDHREVVNVCLRPPLQFPDLVARTRE